MATAMFTKLERFCRDYGVLGIWAFGSRGVEIADLFKGATTTLERKSSDVDLGMLLPRGVKPDGQSRIRMTAVLEDLLDVNRIDLVLLDEASPFLAADIIQGELIMDLSPRETAEFELYVLRRAADLLPFRRARTLAVLREGAR